MCQRKQNTYKGRAYNSFNEPHARGNGNHSHLNDTDTTAVHRGNTTGEHLAAEHEHNALSTLVKCV